MDWRELQKVIDTIHSQINDHGGYDASRLTRKADKAVGMLEDVVAKLRRGVR